MRQVTVTKKSSNIQIADIKGGRILEWVILGLVLLHIRIFIAIAAVSGPTLLRDSRHVSVLHCAKNILSFSYAAVKVGARPI